MPRQLPWANKGGGSRTQVKPPPQPAKKPRVTSDIDDDFFDGTVLANTRPGKGRTEDQSDDDDGFPVIPTEPSTPRTGRKPGDAPRKERAQSSSPPPMADLEEPRVEMMRKGVSKFDLRDDEWMMVEDEFLETAKLFTRHLHIAEYERLKERIEEKKKEAEVAVARPVVPNAKMSVDRMMKEKAKMQEKRQREAIRDVFASQGDDEDETVPSYIKARRTIPAKPFSMAHDSDSDDLDASRPPAKRPSLTGKVSSTSTLPPRPDPSRSAILTEDTPRPNSPPFKKPAPPQLMPKPRTRPSRVTPFDMLDDYVPRKPTTTPKTTPILHEKNSSQLHPPSPSPLKQPLSAHKKSTRSLTNFDDQTSTNVKPSDFQSKATAEHLAKRKAEREKSDKEKSKRRVATLDDIPTFLF